MIPMIKHINFRTLTLLLVIAIVAAGSFWALSSGGLAAGQGNNKPSQAARIREESKADYLERRKKNCKKKCDDDYFVRGYGDSDKYDRCLIDCNTEDIRRVKQRKPRIDTTIERPKNSACKGTCWDTLQKCYYAKDPDPGAWGVYEVPEAEAKACNDAYYECSGQCGSSTSTSRKNIPSKTKQRKPRS